MAIFFGVIFIIAAVVCFCVRTFSTQRRLGKLTGSERKKIGETIEAYRETKKALGDMGEENCVSEDMTIMGMPDCDSPLISPKKKKECIYYSMKVSCKRKEREEYKDSEGVTRTRTVERVEVLDQSTNSTRFSIDDGTGRVVVDPRDAEYDGLVQTVNYSEVYSSNGPTIGYGKFQLTLSSYDRRPETIKYEEEIIGLDRPLTVVGNLCDKMGNLLIEKNGKSRVLISTKSHEELIHEAQASMKKLLIATVVCGILGVVITILGLI